MLIFIIVSVPSAKDFAISFNLSNGVCGSKQGGSIIPPLIIEFFEFEDDFDFNEFEEEDAVY